MEYTNLDGIQVSRLVLGVDFFGTSIDQQTGLAMLEHFVAAGGNMLDTGHVYADWMEGAESSASEKCLGRILSENPDLRAKLMICTKGAHFSIKDPAKTSRVRPDCIRQDLEESLACLQIDSIDLYCLHRDDPDFPLAPIMDELFKAQDEGKIVRLAASNWSNERIEAANRYARSLGRTGFVANQIGYAYIRNLACGGVGPDGDNTMLYFREKEDTAYYRAHPDLTIFAYSSQASGYMTKYLSGTGMNETVRRVYDSALNRARAERAARVAEDLGVPVEAVGLAFLFTRGFPLCALVGPKTMEQLTSTLTAADLKLSDQEISFLEED